MLPIPQVLVSFINKLVSLEEKSSHTGQDLVFTRGDPDIEETIISDDGDESLDMPEDTKGVDRTPTRLQSRPEDVKGGYLNRTFSTPYNNSETLDDSENTDVDIYVYEPEEQVQDPENEPEVEKEPHVHAPESEALVSALGEVALVV